MYSCLKTLIIANEPGGWWSWAGADLAKGYDALIPMLQKYQLNIPLSGPDCHSSNGTKAITNLWKKTQRYIDIYSEHNYNQTLSDQLGTRPLAVADTVVPCMWNEFAGTTEYDYNIQLSRWQIGCYGSGVDGLARWNFINNNDLDGDFSFIQTFDRNTQTLLPIFTRTPNLFYIDGLISRFTATNSNVYSVLSKNKYITPVLFESPNGNLTLIVTNVDRSNNSSVTIKFQDFKTSKTFYRYQITEANKDKENVTVSPSSPIMVSAASPFFTDVLAKNSIYVYSTFKLQMEDKGIVLDGTPKAYSQWKLPDTAIELTDNPVIFDNTNANIKFSDGWINQTEAGAYRGSVLRTKNIGAYFDFDITGTDFKLYGLQNKKPGAAAVYIDSKFAGYASCYSPITRNKMLLFESSMLDNKKHTVRVICEGNILSTSEDNFINIDAIASSTEDAKLSVPLGHETGLSSIKKPIVENITGKNILRNPDFEDGISNWIIKGDTSKFIGITEKFPVRWNLTSLQYGKFALVYASKHKSKQEFSAIFSQTIKNPPAGIYKLRFWERSQGGIPLSMAVVKSSAGNFSKNIPQTLNSEWTQEIIDNIKIKGSCTVEFQTHSILDRWSCVDNVELFKTSEL